jgi:serine/threonine-protein kinase
MAITTAAELIQTLSGLRLLDAAQLDKLQRAVQGHSPEPRTVARELLKHDWLTPFQVNQVLQGKGAELMLGPYVLLERLGEGGMGHVFKARHQLMNRIVAIKIIRKELLAHGDAVERFRREIRLAAQLDHPNLVRAYDAAQVGDTHFLVMEYAEGTDLQRLVQKSGPLPVVQACIYIRQAALGLQHAHERGLVHRDVKPSNLQMTGQGTMVKILDMGLARTQEPDAPRAELTQARSVMGTPDYIAPEQIADPRRVDSRADIYSLGCTFYFLLTGRPPFPEGTWEEKLVCQRKVEPFAVEQVRPDVPPALGAVLRRMMAKRPEERYSTPAAVADALMPFCGMTAPAPVRAAAMPGPFPPVAVPPPMAPAQAVAAPVMAPAAGYEPGWTLKTDATVPPTPDPAASPTTAHLLTQRTVLSATPAPMTPPARRLPWLLAGGLGVVLVAVVAVLLLRDGKPKDTGSGASARDQSKEQVLIDEDFRTPYEKKLALPEGWEGDAFRVGKENELYYTEVSRSSEVHFAKLPPLTLSGNFSIEGVYYLDQPHQSLTLSLENRARSTVLPIVFSWNGRVVIDKDDRLPPQGYKPLKPTQFLVQRQGKKLHILLDKEFPVDKNLEEVTEFDTLRLGLSAGIGWTNRQARLYGLKVTTLPP